MTLVLDSSALVAIVLGEPVAGALVDHLVRQPGRILVGAPTLVEAGIVVSARGGADALTDLHAVLAEVEAEVLAFDEEHAAAAVAAWTRFGKGRHPAALNLGDCHSYAVVKVEDGELLFVGDDFAQTDVRSALI